MMQPAHNPYYAEIASENAIRAIVRPIVRACDQADHETTERIWGDDMTTERVCLECYITIQAAIRDYNNEN